MATYNLCIDWHTYNRTQKSAHVFSGFEANWRKKRNDTHTQIQIQNGFDSFLFLATKCTLFSFKFMKLYCVSDQRKIIAPNLMNETKKWTTTEIYISCFVQPMIAIIVENTYLVLYTLHTKD